MAAFDANQAVRVGGSGFTVFHWMSKPIAFARQVGHTAPEPVGPGPVAIHPMDKKRPVQVITPEAAGMGSITLELYELYGKRVWEDLMDAVFATSGTATRDIVDIFRIVAASPNPVHMTKYIKPPVLGGKIIPTYTETFHNCVITGVQNGETIEVGTMEVLKQITVAYTHSTTVKTAGGQDTTLTTFTVD